MSTLCREREIRDETKLFPLDILLVFCSHIIIWKISYMWLEDQEEFVTLFLQHLPEKPRPDSQGRAELLSNKQHT